MRKTMLAAAAVAAVLSIGATANEAAAMPTTAPTQLGLATSADTAAADSGLVQKAAIVCGYYGCRRVWWGGPYWGHPYWGWHRHWGWRRW
ncbi:MAG TPA: hypothetical protein VK825_08150 [Xanthobacteraceae bacterium]|jgi:hypothetical protein|nr:hypothetical protein [Xanthobacteraceae bacterium]